MEVLFRHKAWKLTRQGRPWSVATLCSHYQISRSHLREWQRLLNERVPDIFEHGRRVSRIPKLEQEIHRLRQEVERLREQTAEQKVRIAELQDGNSVSSGGD